VKERKRRRYEANPEAVRAEWRQYRAEHLEAALERERRRRERQKAIPVTVTGPYAPAEDRIVIEWQGTDLELALALGRSYTGVVSRKGKLRKRGLLG
jgi:hypothetical protein